MSEAAHSGPTAPLLEAQQRAAVVAEARSWIGTPYHHAARLKGVGVDCAMLLAAVYEDCGLVPPIAFDRYPPGWMLHRDTERLLEIVEPRAWLVEEPGEPGDLVVYRYGRAFAHGAIVVEWPVVIHAVQRAGVILDKIDGAQLRGRERKLFSLWSPRVRRGDPAAPVHATISALSVTPSALITPRRVVRRGSPSSLSDL